MLRFALFFALFFILLLSFNSIAIKPTVRFEHLSIEEGLSQVTINNVMQDKQGFLWMATQDGLNRYDGYNFKVFRHSPDDPNAISNSFTRLILQDSKDRIWIGTNDSGFSLYKPQSESFINYSFPPTAPKAADAQIVKAMVEDCQGYLWIGTYKGGLHRFDPQTEQFQHFMHDKDNPNSLSHDKIWALLTDSYCNLWVATSDGVDKLVITKDLSPQSATFIHHKHHQTDVNSLSHQRAYSLLEDSQGFLWVGTRNGLNRTRLSENLNQYANTAHRFSRFSLADVDLRDEQKLTKDRRNFIWTLFEDNSGQIWIGSRGGGLYRFESDSNQLHYYQHLNSDRFSLSNDIVLSITEDKQGQLWVGTFAGGLNKLNLQSLHFKHYKRDPSIHNTLSSNSIRAMQIDNDNNLWIATDNGLNRFDQQNQSFKKYSNDLKDPTSLSGTILTDILVDSNNTLWVGTLSNGLNRYNRDTNNFTRLEFNTTINKSLFGSMVRHLYEDSKNNLWILTNEALCRFEHKTQTFIPYPYEQHDIHSDFKLTDALSIFEDDDGIFWLGTEGHGIVLFNPKTGEFSSAKQRLGHQDIGLERVYSFHKSSNDILWLIGNNGLGKFNLINKQYTLYQKQDGLPNNTIIGILEDEQGHLWLSSNKGLSWFNPTTENFINFTSKDGLQSNEFNSRSFYRSKTGEMFFGGIAGFNRFYPVNIKQDTNPPNVVLTEFLVTNQPIAIKATKNPPHTATKSFTLDKSIDWLDDITLTHKQNLIAVEFAGLHFVDPSENRYAYKLEGQDEQWIYTDSKNRRATYTNLPSGQYQLRIKASNHHKFWQERQKQLTITVLPPPWRTWWAYCIYFMLITIVLSTIIYLYIRKQRLELLTQKKMTQDEQALNQKLKTIDKLKDQFLANTSHELRTPLNGIIGLTESLIDGATGPLSDLTKQNLIMIMTSGRRLSNLVNDILDFSKLKNHNISLQCTQVDLHSLVEVVFALSKPLLGGKDLSLVNNIKTDTPTVWADENRLEQMFHNLVSNAIKFTDSGNITISAEQQSEQVIVMVTDTGIGIAEHKFESIFQSFTQLEDYTVRNHGGTGLGLSVTKQLIELHGGTIEVASTLGKGSTFSLTIPRFESKDQQQSQTLSQLDDSQAIANTTTALSAAPLPPAIVQIDENETLNNSTTLTTNFSILLVEDDPINRQVISNILTLQNYQLSEANSGEQALELIATEGPFDLLLLDIMMPRMSGFEVCTVLRQQYSVSELPIIFLTANNQVSDLVSSFNIGANDYLTKPIAKNELLARVETHLQMLDINKNLEEKVKQRTAQLQQSYDELKATQKQLIEAEKMATLGGLVAGVAHEVNTPLGICITMVSLQLENVKNFENLMVNGKLTKNAMDSYISQTIETQNLVEQHLHRCASLVQEFKEVAVEQSNNSSSTIIFHDYLHQVIDSLTKKVQNDAISLTLTSTPSWLQQTYPNAWWQIIERLFENSLSHGFNGQTTSNQATGNVTISAEKQNDTITLIYRDNGQGMTQEQIDKIYEPFYTTNRNNGGTGLGMHIVHNLVVHKLKGEISCKSKPQHGVEFTIKVPANHN